MQVFDYKELDSTQDQARKLLKTEKLPFIVFANKQTKGRGTQGREWLSPPGGLYFTLCFQLDFNLMKTSKIEELCQSFSLETVACIKDFLEDNYKIENLRVKPINDLYYKDAKLAGILIETINDSNNSTLVLGLGMNLEKIDKQNLDREVISLSELVDVFDLDLIKTKMPKLIIDRLLALDLQIS